MIRLILGSVSSSLVSAGCSAPLGVTEVCALIPLAYISRSRWCSTHLPLPASPWAAMGVRGTTPSMVQVRWLQILASWNACFPPSLAGVCGNPCGVRALVGLSDRDELRRAGEIPSCGCAQRCGQASSRSRPVGNYGRADSIEGLWKWMRGRGDAAPLSRHAPRPLRRLQKLHRRDQPGRARRRPTTLAPLRPRSRSRKTRILKLNAV